MKGTTEPIITTKILDKVFNAGKPNEVWPVRQVNLSIAAGTLTLLKGPSGSGKTTLLTLLSCLARPSAGAYFCLGENVSRWSEKFLTRFRKQHMGIVFQQFNLVSGLTAEQNIALPLMPTALRNSEMAHRAAKAAEQAGISHRLNFSVDTLSGGEQQRVAIARALVNQPKILFADEPTAHLDTATSEKILALIGQLKANGTTILMTTHDPRVEKLTFVDGVIQMVDGQIV